MVSAFLFPKNRKEETIRTTTKGGVLAALPITSCVKNDAIIVMYIVQYDASFSKNTVQFDAYILTFSFFCAIL